MADEFYKTKRDSSLYRTCWNIYPKLLKKLKLGRDEKILDAGCGNGELGKYLNSDKLYGFDIEQSAVWNAKKTSKYKKVVKSEIYELPFKDKEFDKTICIEVFEYLSDPERALNELIRVTKKEIIISSANFNWYRINSYITKGMREQYKNQLKINKNFINSKFFERFAKKNDLKVKIFHVSNRVEKIRNIFGKWLASEVVGVFKLKKKS
jgi:ubiquinone/menaquinone biosynthesis C-methylase UbiE